MRAQPHRTMSDDKPTLCLLAGVRINKWKDNRNNNLPPTSLGELTPAHFVDRLEGSRCFWIRIRSGTSFALSV